MALTRSFKETVKTRAAQEPEFRIGMLSEAIDCLLSNDLATGKVLLRDFVNATIGFEQLGAELGKSPKSLMRMLSETGNPRAENLISLISLLKQREGAVVTVAYEEPLAASRPNRRIFGPQDPGNSTLRAAPLPYQTNNQL